MRCQRAGRGEVRGHGRGARARHDAADDADRVETRVAERPLGERARHLEREENETELERGRQRERRLQAGQRWLGVGPSAAVFRRVKAALAGVPWAAVDIRDGRVSCLRRRSKRSTAIPDSAA